MRIRTNSLERKSNVRETRAKLFLMMEGTDTEPLYFQEFFAGKEDVEYLPFERDIHELGWSNPYLLMNELKLELGRDIEELSYADFMPFLIRHLKSSNPTLDIGLFKQKFNDRLHKKRCNLKDFCSSSTIEEIFQDLKNTSFIGLLYEGLGDVLNDFSNLIGGDYSFDAGIDRIALVVDRDHHSFSESQFDAVVRDGEENHVEIYVTNPCFEFFLALHLSKMMDVDKNALLENKKSDDYTFVHHELLKLDPTFTKERYDAQRYVASCKTAIFNLSYYEQDLRRLKNNVGSNLSSLLEKYLS